MTRTHLRLALAASLFAFACSSNSTPTGKLAVTISGLPSGAQAAVTITGPSNYSEAITSSETLEPPAGVYSASAQPVTSAGQTYTASISGSPATVESEHSASIGVTYSLQIVAPTTGTLHVAISGLPSGTNATADISGPNGYDHIAAATSDLDSLAPGSYSAAAADISVGSDSYTAAISGSPAQVTAGGTAEIDVTYSKVVVAPTTGSLEIDISGLPSGLNAAVTINGPGGYMHKLTGPDTLTGLTPGSYSITASNVSNGTTYTAVVTGSPATVTAGNTATASVTYAAANNSIELTITGLSQSDMADITVSGPNGYSAHTNQYASETFSGLLPGDYTVTANPITNSDQEATAVTVTGSPLHLSGGTTASATVAYSVVTGTLVVDVVYGNPVKGSVSISGDFYGISGYNVITAHTEKTVPVGTFHLGANPYTYNGVRYTPDQTSVDMVVTANQTTSATITYSVPAPVVTTFGQTYGKSGSNNSFSGSNFPSDAETVVTVDGAPVAATVNTQGTFVSFTMPAHDPGNVQVTLNTHGGSGGSYTFDYYSIANYFLSDAGSGGTGGVAIGPDGNPWMTEVGFGRIATVAADGGVTEFPVPDAGTSLTDIAAGGDGALWFTDADRALIGRITTAGTVTTFATPSGCESYGATATSDGKVWFTELGCPGGKNSIGVIDPANTGTIHEYPYPFEQVMGITSDSSGNLWFAKLNSRSLGELTPDGMTFSDFSATSTTPYWLTFGADGNLWYSDGAVATMTTAGVNTVLSSGTIATGATSHLCAEPDGIWVSGYSAQAGDVDLTTHKARLFVLPGIPSGIACGPNRTVWIHESYAVTDYINIGMVSQIRY